MSGKCGVFRKALTAHAYPLCATCHCERPRRPNSGNTVIPVGAKTPNFLVHHLPFVAKSRPITPHNPPKIPKNPQFRHLRPVTLPPCSNPYPIRTILPNAQIQPAPGPTGADPISTSQHREPPSPKSAHLTANTATTAAKTLPSAPIQPHDPPDALLELAEMRGNEREIDLSVFSPRNYK